MKPLKIYLADLTHTGNGVATESMPLNIGLIASYTNKIFGDRVEIELFKYPEDLLEALEKSPPQILGCSNYTWNFNLAYHFASIAKKISPQTVTVFGGTNYPFNSKSQEEFLRKYPNIDLHTFYEGELAFEAFLNHYLEFFGTENLLSSPVGGCQFIRKSDGAFLEGEKLARIQSLDQIPSPYVSGLLDKFFDGILTPLVETARGCPFKCNFCNAGNTYFNNVNLFSNCYVETELRYIAKKATECGSYHVTFTDNNFGMIPRDSKTAEVLQKCYDELGWPRSITVWTGKNSKERVIEITRTLGEKLSISMSVQSMDAEVLKNIQRDNIKLAHFKTIADELNAEGRPQHAEVIMPLPGETYASHIQGLNELLDTNVSKVNSHTLQMLYGTSYKDDPSYRASYGFVTKFRVVPLDFSKIRNDCIFDVEEVAIATDQFSFEEYIEARKYLLLIDLCYNTGLFSPLVTYLNDRNIPTSAWIASIHQNLPRFSESSRQVIQSFASESKGELWDREEELVQHYSLPENYQKLISYESGGNVLFKHRVSMLAFNAKGWVDDIFNQTEILIRQNAGSDDNPYHPDELEDLKSFILSSVDGCYDPKTFDSEVKKKYRYDILSWLAAAKTNRKYLGQYISSDPIEYSFEMDKLSQSVFRDGMVRYGTAISGLVKLIQRAPSLRITKSVRQTGNEAPSATFSGAFQGSGPGSCSL